MFDAIAAHRDLGILFIAAAGNSSSNNDAGNFYPASYFLPNVIAVAATTRTDARAGFSSYGAHTVHLGAPGNEILSTTIGNTYSTFSGTSMATPHVTGVAALLKACTAAPACPYSGVDLDWRAIKNRILAGGENIPSMANVTITGKRLNAHGALTCANSVVLARVRPSLNTVVAAAGVPISLDALHINCAAPNGPVAVNASTGQVVTLQDTEGDGIYSGTWTPPGVGNYTLTFPNNDVVQVIVLQPYAYSATSYSYRSIAGTSLNFTDDSTAAISPGFPILFGGSSFNTLFVSSNGNVNFTTPFPDYSNSQLTDPPASAVGTLVAPFWDDLYSLSGTVQNVFWEVIGSSPNRQLVIEWRDVLHFSCSADGTATVRFQIVFFEGSSDILFNYADVVFGGACAASDRGGSATIGVQTASNQATTYSFNTQSLGDGTALLWTLATPPPPPSLGVTPSSLDFGTVAVGATADQSFTVTNTGAGMLTGSAATSAPSFSIVPPTGSFTLGPGASSAVTVRFSPTAPDTYNGGVDFTSNGGSETHAVTGMGVSPSITVVSPAAGVEWANGLNQDIRWTSGVTGNVKIQLSRDGGVKWTDLFPSTPNDGFQSWKVKRPQTTQARIRICSISAPSVCDTSQNFTIK